MQNRKRNGRILVFLLLGAVIAVLLVWLSNIIYSWGVNTQQDWTYTSNFRTYSVDQAIGLGGDSPQQPSHFIVQNDKSQIIVIVMPADSAQHAVILTGPTLVGDGADHIPVILSFKDTTNSGHLDVLINFQGHTITFLNDGNHLTQKTS